MPTKEENVNIDVKASVFLSIALAATLILVKPAFEQTSTSSVTDPRPLNAVSDVLEQALGAPVNYEDPPYPNVGDLEDIQLLQYGHMTPGYQLLVPRRATVTGAILAKPDSSDAEKMATIETLLVRYRSNQLTEDFKVEQANGTFYIIPTKALSKSGVAIARRP